MVEQLWSFGGSFRDMVEQLWSFSGSLGAGYSKLKLHMHKEKIHPHLCPLGWPLWVK